MDAVVDSPSDAILIVGGGQAAVAAASKLRALEVKRPITIIADETVLPYQRPPLSKSYLLGGASFNDIMLRPEQWYDDLDIEVLTNTRVTRIDRSTQSLTFSTGRTRCYGSLILATGGSPRAWPADLGGTLDGVYVARDKVDADRLIPEMRPGRRILIVGGGYVGLEAAAVAAKIGLHVTLIETESRILNRVAAPATSDFLRALHESHGVSIKEAVGLKRFIGENGRVNAALLSDGSLLSIDFAIVGIGIIPNVGLASESGLDVNNGILVDQFGKTVDPNIFAVGDCAAFPYEDNILRLECVQNAIEHAETAAAAIAGMPRPYSPVPWFWSDQYDIKLQIAGLNKGYTDTVVRQGKREHDYSVWYFKDERFLAVDSMNDGKVFVLGKKLLARGVSPSKELIGDGRTDLIAYARSLLN